MNLRMPGHLAERFHGETQKTREVTETWCAENLFCPACPSPKLMRLPGSTRVADLYCPKCSLRYELKAHRQSLGSRIPDGQYDTMMKMLRSNERPHFLLMHYEREIWEVVDLLLVPSFLVSPSAVHCRKPTWPKGRAQSWTGCDLLLDRIPKQGRIEVVTKRNPIGSTEVRRELSRVRALEKVDFQRRGWQVETLRVVDNLGKAEFTNRDMYSHAEELKEIFPNNNNVDDKIRQQLQFLCKAGLLEHVAPGRWRRVG
jgi:type II restriction enzyme